MKTNSFFKNTIVILITSLIIKILGLLNKILITKSLNIDGMSLYVLTMPSVVLLTSISSLSLNSVMSKLISENLTVKKFSNKKLLTNAILLSLLVSIFVILILLLFINILTKNLLNNANLFFPILSSVFLIPLVGISDCLRGYFNGLKNMKVSSLSTLIEQISRITSTLVFILITIKYNYILSVSLCVIGLAIGEICSIIYTLIKLKKEGLENKPGTKGEINAIIKEAVPPTLSRLISSFSHFLEPIIYTNVLLFLLYDQATISTTYTTISAFVIPFITLTSFVSNAISTSIIPGIAESNIKKDLKSVHYYIDKAIIFSLVPGIFSCTIFYLFSKEYLELLFGTTNGINIIKYTVFLTLPYYLQMPFTSILQALNKNKLNFALTIIFNLSKLTLITILSFIPIISIYSIIVSLIIVIFIDTFSMYFFIKRYTKYKLNLNEIFSILLIFFFIFFFTLLLKLIGIHYIIITLLSFIVTLILIVKFNLITFNTFISLFKRKKSD